MQTIDRTSYLIIPRTSARRLLAVARLLLARLPTKGHDNLKRFVTALVAAVENLTAAYVERHLETNGATPAQDSEFDTFIDVLWAALRDRLGHWEVFLRAGALHLATIQDGEEGFDYATAAEDAKDALRIRERLFGHGGLEFTKLRYVEQAEYMRTLWLVIEQEEFGPTVQNLVGAEFYLALQDGQARYIEMIGRRSEQQRGSKVNLRDLDIALRSAMQNYVIAVLGLIDDEDPKTGAMVQSSLQPLDALREQLERERGSGRAAASDVLDEAVVAELLAEEQAIDAELGIDASAPVAEA